MTSERFLLPLRRRRRFGAWVIGTTAAVTAVGLAACGSTGRASTAPPAAAARSIAVVTGLYPLAQAAEQIGGRDVQVVDIVTAGSNPRTYQPTAADDHQLRTAPVVLLVGGGFQPAVEAAAASNTSGVVLNLRADLKIPDDYPWLDPPEMHNAVQAITTALSQADPGGAGTFRRNAADFADEIDSTGIDFQSTLSACPRHAIVTPDDAFGTLATTYGLTDQVVTSPAEETAAAAAATSSELTTAFVEPFAETQAVTAVATDAHLKLRTLDPLTGAPPAGWPAQANYINLMEANLGALSNALGCPNQATGS